MSRLWKQFASEIVSRPYLYGWPCRPKRLRYVFFWVVTQRLMLTPDWRFRTTYVPSPRIKKTLEDGTDILSRNTGKELPPYPALYPRREQVAFISRRKPEIARSCGISLAFEFTNLFLWHLVGLLVRGISPLQIYWSEERQTQRTRGNICMLRVESETTVLRLEWLKTVLRHHTTCISS
jgi:hypothetical protein